jgi:hypothetical protein
MERYFWNSWRAGVEWLDVRYGKQTIETEIKPHMLKKANALATVEPLRLQLILRESFPVS